MVAPADEHGDASADDVEARPVLLDRLHALLLGQTRPLLPSSSSLWLCLWTRRGGGAAAAASGGGGSCASPAAAHAGGVAPAQQGAAAGGIHGVRPAGSAPPLLGQLPLVVPTSRIHPPPPVLSAGSLLNALS